MKTTIKTWCLAELLLAGMGLGMGCASDPAVRSQEPKVPAEPARMVCASGVTADEAVQAAEFVLTRMHFPIEKLDAEQGIVRTRPLRAAQFFEFWRSDNASCLRWEEANLQSIRRSVELHVTKETADGGPQAGGVSSRLCLQCTVSVQRLSLPANEVAGTSEAYRIHSSSVPTLQRIEPSPQQRRAMAWIDQGQDPALAARIIERIGKRLSQMK